MISGVDEVTVLVVLENAIDSPSFSADHNHALRKRLEIDQSKRFRCAWHNIEMRITHFLEALRSKFVTQKVDPFLQAQPPDELFRMLPFSTAPYCVKRQLSRSRTVASARIVTSVLFFLSRRHTVKSRRWSEAHLARTADSGRINSSSILLCQRGRRTSASQERQTSTDVPTPGSEKRERQP